MFAKLWRRFRQGNKRREQLKDDAAVWRVPAQAGGIRAR